MRYLVLILGLVGCAVDTTGLPQCPERLQAGVYIVRGTLTAENDQCNPSFASFATIGVNGGETIDSGCTESFQDNNKCGLEQSIRCSPETLFDISYVGHSAEAVFVADGVRCDYHLEYEFVE